MKVQVTAPGKLILFGEHAVVYKKKAIATSLDDLRASIVLTTRVESSSEGPTLSFNSDKIGFNNFSIPVSQFSSLKSLVLPPQSQQPMDDTFVPKVNEQVVSQLVSIIKEELEKRPPTEIAPRIVSLVGAMYLYLYLSEQDSEHCGNASIEIEADTNLPIGAGLGSSASFSVCLSGAMLTAFNVVSSSESRSQQELQTINKWAYFVEELIHGTPSGIDNTVATFGGVVSFIKGETPVTLPSIPGNLSLLIVDTTVPRDTKALVLGVRNRYEQDMTTYETYMNDIEACSNNCLSLFSDMQDGKLDRDSYIQQFQSLIDKNQELLQAIGVSHPSLEKVVQIASEFGLHAKLTGAGGGGCSFVLLDDNEEKTAQFKQALTKEGFNCYLSSVGHEGVITTIIASD